MNNYFKQSVSKIFVLFMTPLLITPGHLHFLGHWKPYIVPSPYQEFDIITHTIKLGVDIWRIDRPNVKQPETKYPNIPFLPGDRITVTAGGCVQTGGRGKTWKQYVNPQGPNSDNLYHGLIKINGATFGGGYERIGKVIGRQLKVSALKDDGAGSDEQILYLGYEDDNYDDNGYSGHDDGTSDQCKGEGPAWVQLIVYRVIPAPPKTSPRTGLQNNYQTGQTR